MSTPCYVTLAALLAGCDGWASTVSDGGAAGTPSGSPSTTTAGVGAHGGGGAGGRGHGGHAGAGSGGTGGIVTSQNCDPPSGPEGSLKLTKLVDVASPVLVTQPPGVSEWLLVATHSGLLYRLEEGVLSPFLDLTGKVFVSGESGLVGVAFHPGYAENGRFFVHYMVAGADGGANVVEEYRRSADPLLADSTPVGDLLIHSPKLATNHCGGMLAFSPIDALLYIGIGDGGGATDVAQDLTTLRGKILRIDVATNPPTNPTGNVPGGLPEIWDYGLRQPHRFAFDACNGDFYIADVGALTTEELMVEPPGTGNKNYGWRRMEGTACYDPPANCDPQGLVAPPTVEFGHADGYCSLVGGFVYRGSAIPWLRGRYVYGDFCQKFGSLRWDGTEVIDMLDHSDDLGLTVHPSFHISSLGQDNAGELYVLNWYLGEVHRLDPN
jgi:glucose/arabinose dehydrogenase